MLESIAVELELKNLPMKEEPIEVDMTDDDLIVLSDKINNTILELELKKDEKKSYDSSMSVKIKELESTINTDSSEYRSKKKTIFVNCYYRKNYVSRKMEFISCETGEIIKETWLERSDVQPSFDGFNLMSIENGTD